MCRMEFGWIVVPLKEIESMFSLEFFERGYFIISICCGFSNEQFRGNFFALVGQGCGEWSAAGQMIRGLKAFKRRIPGNNPSL